MGRHPNAKLTPRGRKTLVPRMESGAPIVDAARQMGVGRQTASKWLPRSRPGEAPSDRNGRTRRLEKSTPVARSRPLRYERERRASSSTSTSRKRRAYPTAAGNARWGADACRRTAPGVVPARRCRRPQRGRLRRATARRAPGRLRCLIEHCIGTVRTARTGTFRPCRASSA